MSADVQQALSVSPNLSNDKNDARTNKDPLHRRPSFHLIHKRHKDEYRKRSQRHMHHTGGPAVKRRKKDMLIPPTKFLLGGNIRDPLNLNSLRDEEVNRRLNAVTPETSPMPTPQWKKGEVEVLLPPNIHDPLNLEGSQSPCVYLSTPSLKKNRKKHKKKKQRSSTEQQFEDSSGETVQTTTTTTQSSLNSSGNTIPDDDHSQSQKVSDEKCEVKVIQSSTKEADDAKFLLPLPVQVIKEQNIPTPAVPPSTLSIAKNVDPHMCKKGKSSSSKKAVDKIVSPVVKQPGTTCSTNSTRRKPQQHSTTSKPEKMPSFKESNKKFQYGNYNRYYGYRNAEYEIDPRLRLLEMRPDLFEGKEVLDIGCNTGHVTLAIASDMAAARVVGLDLDKKLVEAAKSNIKHYIRRSRGNSVCSTNRTGHQSYPVSMSLLYGPLPDTRTHPHTTFPHNVTFTQGNYVLSSDVLVDLETPQFDTILCLSVTKWFHLNWGDDGLKRAFRRMYAQLKPGGTLILEPQPWSSYKKKKNITETTWKHFQSIELFPQKFTQFLLSEVGFTKCEVLGSPIHNSKGFQRPIKIFTKGHCRRRLDSVGNKSACSENFMDIGSDKNEEMISTEEKLIENKEDFKDISLITDDSKLQEQLRTDESCINEQSTHTDNSECLKQIVEASHKEDISKPSSNVTKVPDSTSNIKTEVTDSSKISSFNLLENIVDDT